MADIEITLTLPADIVEQATAAGLLDPAHLTELLRSELDRKQRLARFSTTLSQLASLQPPLTTDEIAAELNAYRAEKRRQ